MGATSWCRRVTRSVNGHLYFSIEGAALVYACEADEACRRCKKPFGDERPSVLVTVTMVSSRRLSAAEKVEVFDWLAMTTGRTAAHNRYRVGLYHERCIPPDVFHAAAGSRPAPGRSRVVTADVRSSPPRAARSGVSATTALKTAEGQA